VGGKADQSQKTLKNRYFQGARDLSSDLSSVNAGAAENAHAAGGAGALCIAIGSR